MQEAEAVPRQEDVVERIRGLGQLRDEGLLTDDEFEDAKRELLRRM